MKVRVRIRMAPSMNDYERGLVQAADDALGSIHSMNLRIMDMKTRNAIHEARNRLSLALIPFLGTKKHGKVCAHCRTQLHDDITVCWYCGEKV